MYVQDLPTTTIVLAREGETEHAQITGGRPLEGNPNKGTSSFYFLLAGYGNPNPGGISRTRLPLWFRAGALTLEDNPKGSFPSTDTGYVNPNPGGISLAYPYGSFRAGDPSLPQVNPKGTGYGSFLDPSAVCMEPLSRLGLGLGLGVY